MSIGRLPLHGVHESLGAEFIERGGSLVPESYGDPGGEYESARNRAGISDLSDRGKLRLSGKDHLKFLQGMLTNDVMKLGEGEGMYAAILTVKGRMLSDMRVYREKESVLLDLEPGLNVKVGEILKRYRLSYKANIDDLTESIGLLHVHGPLARRLLAEATGAEKLPLDEFGHMRAAIDGRDVTIVKISRTGGEGYDIYALSDALSDIWKVLMEKGGARGILPVGRAALDTLRIEAGIPIYGADMDEETIPIE
ncbi:MAG: aminomethyl transferase family protein, partial [Candidatus Dadabacteria bacterium]